MSTPILQSRRRSGRRMTTAALMALVITAAAAIPSAVQAKPKPKPKGDDVSVMSRNVYLGADLGPAIGATGFGDFIAKNGQILRDVDTNNFPVRAKGLAKEILSKSPDLVGLQEAALWRTGAVNLAAALAGGCGTGACTATTVKYDFLKTLLDQLNKGKQHYKLVKSQDEFDFEAPGDYDNNPANGTLGGEIDGRLTMRDAILAKVGAGIKVSGVKAGHYDTLYQPTISGIPVPVTRGWLAINAKVRNSRTFRFINTHFEAFGDTAVREAQAKELFDANGPAKTGLPVILVGDLNSDDDTVSATNGDRLAYNALKGAGFRERSTNKPLGCCLSSSILTSNLGSKSDFDHQVDHIMTRDPSKVKLLSSAVTGLAPVNGYWDSDHAGIFSNLRIFR